MQNKSDLNTRIAVLAAIFICWHSVAGPVGAQYVPYGPGSGPDLSASTQADLTINVDLDQTRQRMDSFGASDAWTTKYVGLWPDEIRNRLAELLFCTELDQQGNPKGIGLTAWRFNIGAGSLRQDNVRTEWKQADVFYNEDFTDYDWTRQPGSRWFLAKAHEYGVHEITAFLNSPPITMTKNGIAFVTPGKRHSNLRDDKYEDFAIFMADVVKHFEDKGMGFDYISPVNEPQWDWADPKQEGTPYENQQIARLVRYLHKHLEKVGSSTEILINDSGQIQWMYEYRDGKGNYIEEFFHPDSDNYVGDLVAQRITCHSYWTDTPESGLVRTRNRLRQKLDEYPHLEYEMSEYCILGPMGRGRDLGIEPAMRTARTIHYDLTLTDSVGWHWWLGISLGNWKDGLLYADYDTKQYYSSKLLWGLGNYSRFIRPGMYRIEAVRSDDKGPADTADDLMVSSYYNNDTGHVVTVAVNPTDQNRYFNLRISKSGRQQSHTPIVPYITSADYDLTPGPALQSNTVAIPPKSIVTLIAETDN